MDYSELDIKKKELLRKEKLKGIMIRSRAQWLSEGEKPSKYFCSLEKHYYTEKNDKKIVTEDGKILNDQTKIMNELKGFYKTLFCSRDAKFLITVQRIWTH